MLEDWLTKVLNIFNKTREGALLSAGFLIAVYLYIAFTVQRSEGVLKIVEIIALFVLPFLIAILITRGRGKNIY